MTAEYEKGVLIKIQKYIILDQKIQNEYDRLIIGDKTHDDIMKAIRSPPTEKPFEDPEELKESARRNYEFLSKKLNILSILLNKLFDIYIGNKFYRKLYEHTVKVILHHNLHKMIPDELDHKKSFYTQFLTGIVINIIKEVLLISKVKQGLITEKIEYNGDGSDLYTESDNDDLDLYYVDDDEIPQNEDEKTKQNRLNKEKVIHDYLNSKFKFLYFDPNKIDDRTRKIMDAIRKLEDENGKFL
jgi:hypothetical protein